MPELIPAATPQSILALIQNNYLLKGFHDAMRPWSRYRRDAKRQRLEPHTGQTATHSRIGTFNADLAPLATALGDPPVATFNTEQFTAAPIPYGLSFVVDGPTAYVQGGDYVLQGCKGLAEWAGRTQSRLARGKLFAGYGGGTAITRRQQVAGNTVLLVNTLAGFRFRNGPTGMQAVSGSTPLDILIGATPNTITGVTPINNNYPDGPGALTLGTALGGTVTAQTVVTALNAPYAQRPNARTSTETIVVTDLPKVIDLMTMRSRLFDNAVNPHADGTFHLHCDASFMLCLVQDPQWATVTQGMGPSDAWGEPGGTRIPMLGLTIFEVPDSPGPARGEEVLVGSLTGGPSGTTGVEPSGAAGTPASSRSMRDVGLDTRNSAGLGIRRAIMTGGELLIETYVDIPLYWSAIGIRKIADVNPNVSQYQMSEGGMKFFAAETEGWLMVFLPALNPLQSFMKISVQATFDYTLATDLTSAAGGNNGPNDNQKVPLKRAIALEYSFAGA